MSDFFLEKTGNNDILILQILISWQIGKQWPLPYAVINPYEEYQTNSPLLPQSLHVNNSSSSPYLFLSLPPLQKPHISLKAACSSGVISSSSSTVSPSDFIRP